MDTNSSVKVGKDLSEPFETMAGLRQGDTLPCDLFNILMGILMRKAEKNTSKTISSKSHILLAYADNVVIMDRTTRKVTSAFWKIEKVSAKVGLTVNEELP